MIWREKRWVLIGVGAFLLANILFFVTYRIRYEERVNDLDTRLGEARDLLKSARNERTAAQQELATYRDTVKNINTIYGEVWSTSERRLTPMIVEVRQLTNRSGLRLKSVGYGRTDQKKELGATDFNVSFGVQGTYAQVRRLINLIELSPQFVIIDEISLAESGGSSQLQMNLRLKTLFRSAAARPALEAS